MIAEWNQQIRCLVNAVFTALPSPIVLVRAEVGTRTSTNWYHLACVLVSARPYFQGNGSN
eukprot:4120018-Amphidinium_carterae.1